MPKKIVVIGPESTGKSLLCSELANHYKTKWVQEYAREYLENYGKVYSFEDLSNIAAGQILCENEIASQLKSNDLLFVDTDAYVMKVWSEFVFGKCDLKILNTIANRKYDLYLLMNIDLPWQQDELREYPDYAAREKLFHFYHDAMINQNVPFKIISGMNKERTKNAITFIDSRLF